MSEKTLPTQKFVKIEDIRNGVVFLKDGGLRKVLIVNGINFDLKSDEEQKMILASFQRFLNTLDFSVQFFIHSRKVNISSYLEKIKVREDEEQNELLKIQISEYMEFVRSFVEENPIITKSFFVVVPYSPGPESVQQATKGFLDYFKKNKNKGDNKSIQENLQQLSYREDEVVSGLGAIGLRAQPLDNEEIVELFYNLYNPGLIEKQGGEIPKFEQIINKG